MVTGTVFVPGYRVFQKNMRIHTIYLVCSFVYRTGIKVYINLKNNHTMPIFRSQFEDLDILIMDLLDLISCEVNILPGSSLPQDEDLISNATSQIVSIIDEYGTTCTTDYQQFLEEFSRWKLTVENTLKDDSDIKLISETYSVAINVDSTLDDLQNQTKMLNELQQRHSEGTISIHELSTALSSEPYVKLRRELNDKKDHIMEQIFTVIAIHRQFTFLFIIYPYIPIKQARFNQRSINKHNRFIV